MGRRMQRLSREKLESSQRERQGAARLPENGGREEQTVRRGNEAGQEETEATGCNGRHQTR